MAMIEAEVPLAETFGYSTDLRSMTQGQGTFTMEFSKYRRVPASIQEEIMAEKKKQPGRGEVSRCDDRLQQTSRPKGQPRQVTAIPVRGSWAVGRLARRQAQVVLQFAFAHLAALVGLPEVAEPTSRQVSQPSP